MAGNKRGLHIHSASLATEAEVESLSEVLAAEEVETQVNNGKSEEVLDASIEVTNSSPTCEETEEASKEESSDVGSDEESKESAVITNTSNGVNHIDYLGVD
ncbi:hypothetical protein SK128_011887 [Halocaridina rubra]|uniref:Uncharacterized protein n=1 Tax=Halocaridina rubra TaxID=373956 RepID=A0AAN9AAZ7_HALRR